MNVESIPSPAVAAAAHWRRISQAALRGLVVTYSTPSAPLPFTRVQNGSRIACRGSSIRYALISLLGLARSCEVTDESTRLKRHLWSVVENHEDDAALSAGDLGMGLWARSLNPGCGERFSIDRALRKLREHPTECDSVELAWLLLGADHAAMSAIELNGVETLAAEAKAQLLALYNPRTRLFYRHARLGRAAAVSRRVACFANQIYPVMALAVHARRTGCPRSLQVAGAVADQLCMQQGKLGQWWWLYDARDGGVVDGFPVFSVHQDGMAPMALLELTRAGGRSYVDEIERGLGWVLGENELGLDMVRDAEGMIFRDIHRRGVGRVRRMIRGTLWCCGWRRDGGDGSACHSYDLNRECRPYHLGWVLYAAALKRTHLQGGSAT